jgi:7-cyano-7-deazaguanine reductase
MSRRSPSTISASWPSVRPRKLYLMQFRDQGHFCEALAVRIRDDVAEALELGADAVRVTLVQKARGGITITARS